MEPQPTKALPDLRAERRARDFSKDLAAKGNWYHSFRLPDGTLIDGLQTIEHQEDRFSQFPIPADLSGKKILDIGAWDGWFSFEAERRGASVVAVDLVEAPHFLEMHKRLGSRVQYRILDVYELPAASLGQFDYVFFLGVLYHIKHPLLALEIVCSLTSEMAIVNSFVVDGDNWQENIGAIPWTEFYETDELGGHLDNWFGPTTGCLIAMCRAAGFARVEVLSVGSHATLACYKKWGAPPDRDRAEQAPIFRAVTNNQTWGINFKSTKDQYIGYWIEVQNNATPSRADIMPEIDGIGVPVLAVQKESQRLFRFITRLPPGLAPGWKDVCVRLTGTRPSNRLRIAIDIPEICESLVIQSVYDGVAWTENSIQSRYITLWIQGLPDNADVSNVKVYLGDNTPRIEYLGSADSNSLRQVNCLVSESLPHGCHDLKVRFGKTESAPRQVLVGTPIG